MLEVSGMGELGGIEPQTSTLPQQQTKHKMVELGGIEPPTSTMPL